MKRFYSLSNPFKQNRLLGRMAVVLPALLVVSMLAVPTGYASEPGGSSASAKQNQGDAPTSYTLMGDSSMNYGGGRTEFHTTLGNNVYGNVFQFDSSATDSYVTTLEGRATAGPSGTGVSGLGTRRGVYGYSSTSAGVGVWGDSSAGASGSGVYGTSTGSNSAGVWGIANNGTASAGIYGGSTVGKGVWGYTTSGDGVYGASSSGNGVYGYSSSATGVGGVSNSGIGLYGQSSTGSGFYGFSSGGPGGVMGSNTTEGARFYTRNASSYALVTGGLSGTYGNVYITGNYQATGTKSARVETSRGPRLMYATEGTQNIFSDQGTAQLINGRAVVTIDPLYAQTVNLAEDYQVFLTPRAADTYGLAVVSQNSTTFVVQELHGGTGSFKFNWKVEALRKGYEKDRLEDAGPAPAAAGPAYEAPTMAPAATQKPEK